MAKLRTRLPTSRGFARQHGFRNVATVLVVFCEGKTEAEYLKALARRHRRPSVDVVVIPQCGEPGAVSKAACTRRDELGGKRRRLRKKADTKNCLESYEVWAAFDRDEHPHFYAAIDRCIGKGVGLAVTVPCVELWAVLHVQAHAAPIERHPCQHLLKRIMPGYDHSSKAQFQLAQMDSEAQAQAVTRALLLHRDAADSAGDGAVAMWRNPLTTMWKLVAAIEHGSSSAARAATRDSPAAEWWLVSDPGC